jgi:4-amino-4-deoxy-L-arabinose transferase-like glycosyltransferase
VVGKRKLLPALLVFITALVFLVAFWSFRGNGFLGFSDAAKFSDIARNIVAGRGYVTDFVFFDTSLKDLPTYAFWIRPLMPLGIAASFMFFGISDFAVFATSGFFYLLITLFVYLLGRKLFGETAGVLTTLAVAANVNLLDYATSGASESLFIFEIVVVAYLVLFKKRWADFLGLLTLIAMYFTRPQAFIYIVGFILYWLLLRYDMKKAIILLAGTILLLVLVDILMLRVSGGRFLLYSIISQGEFAIGKHLPGLSSSVSLRGMEVNAQAVDIGKKLFYNLYNFYRLLPQIASPYLWAFFLIGLIKWGRNREENSLKISTIFMVVGTFLGVALTVPLFRYLHPIIPLVYIFAIASLIQIVRSVFRSERKIVFVTSILVAFFVLGQTLGAILLDSRFEAKRVNKDQVPVYVVLSKILKENTNQKDTVVTNLDSWGTWYGERKTIWYPIMPEQLDIDGNENPFDVIYLTSYLIDDENYFMGAAWRQILENPKNIENKFIKENYMFSAEFNIPAEDTYERISSRAVLLVRKPH